MRIVLLVFGWYAVIAGLLLCVQPSVMMRWMKTLIQSGVNRALGLPALVIGGLILWAVPASQAPLFIQALGWLSIAKGAYYILAPRQQRIGFFTWWVELSRGVYILWGIFSVALGMIVLRTL